jgi:hypothetical protein
LAASGFDECHLLSQARNLPVEHVRLNVHGVDSHRLAYYLDKQSQLVPLVLEALKQRRKIVGDAAL